MEFGDREEAEVIAALLGGFAGFFVKPWNLAAVESAVVGFSFAAGVTMLIGRLGHSNFEPDNSAVLGVFVTLMVMHAAVV